MKKILMLIFICAALAFTACGRNADSGLSDEEYLTKYGRSLERGMTVDDVIEKMGEADEYVGIYDDMPFTAPSLVYYRGEYRLIVTFRRLEMTAEGISLMHWISDDNIEMIFVEKL